MNQSDLKKKLAENITHILSRHPYEVVLKYSKMLTKDISDADVEERNGEYSYISVKNIPLETLRKIHDIIKKL